MGNDKSNINQSHEGSGHNVGRDLHIYNSSNGDDATDIAIAMLVGSWDESKNNDILVLEHITSEKYTDWIIKIRRIEALNNSPLKHDSGIWRVKNRTDIWSEYSPRLYDDHLNKFKSISIKIFSTVDPKFKLKPEHRFYASIYGKILPHSSSIRNGLAEGLVLISTKKKSLTNCSSNYGEYIANAVIKKVFDSSNWMLWASTQDIQPVMAEAAPSDFLSAVESAIAHKEKPFHTLFSQKCLIGIPGKNHITGLLWGIECLAWSPIYLTKCVILLGEMDSCWSRGNGRSKSVNSIINILLPWHPQTTAPFSRRLASLKALERELPETAWEVLLNLLPHFGQSTFGTYTPRWREFRPKSVKKEVMDKKCYEQTIELANYAVELSKKDNSRLAKLVEHLCNLHNEAFTAAVQVLFEYSASESSAEKKYTLWTQVLSLITHHQEFPDTFWALSNEKLNQLKPVVEKLTPVNIFFLYQRLFTARAMSLNSNKLTSIEREEAVSELFSEGSYELVYKFSQAVMLTSEVGSLLALTEEIDVELLKKYLKLDDIKTNEYISAYIFKRNHLTNGLFIENMKLDSWGQEEVSRLLLLLPCDIKTFVKVDKELGRNSEHLYWSKVDVNPYFFDDDEDDVYRCVDYLLKHNRPFSSIHCLAILLRMKKTLRIEPTVKALVAAAYTKEIATNITSYDIREIIKYLQINDQLTDTDRFKIESIYLDLIFNERDENSPFTYWDEKLSKEPIFFCERVSLYYKSKLERKPNKSHKNVIDYTYKIFDTWKKVPGSQEDGSFKSSDFKNWIDKVVKISKKSGYLNLALSFIGQNLIHSPKNTDGLWIHETLAEFLNQKEWDNVRDAFKIATFNSRGIYTCDPEAKPEIELSEKYQTRSETIESLGYQRFATTLLEISNIYALEAETIIKKNK